MVNDSLGDFLARIKNAISAGHESVTLPNTKMIETVAGILKKEGFVADFKTAKVEPQSEITVELKYVNGVSAIRDLVRKSKPGRRIYIGYRDIKRVKEGFGLGIVSTPKGVLTNKQVKELKVAGEYLFDVY